MSDAVNITNIKDQLNELKKEIKKEYNSDIQHNILDDTRAMVDDFIWDNKLSVPRTNYNQSKIGFLSKLDLLWNNVPNYKKL